MVLPRGNTNYSLQNGQKFNRQRNFTTVDPYGNNQANRGMSERPRGRLGQVMANVPQIPMPGMNEAGSVDPTYGAFGPQHIDSRPGPRVPQTMRSFPMPYDEGVSIPKIHPGHFTPSGQAADRQVQQGILNGQREEQYFNGVQDARHDLSSRNRSVYGGMGQQGAYQQRLGGIADSINQGGAAPTYRAGQQGLTPSQQRMLAGPAQPPVGTPAGWTAEGTPEVTHRRMIAGQSPNYVHGEGFVGSDGRDIFVRSPGAGRGLALAGANGPRFVGANGTTEEQYFAKGRERAQQAKDNRMASLAARGEIPRGLPNVQAAMGRQSERFSGGRLKQDLAAHDATIAALRATELEHHMKHAATLPPLKAAEYISGLRSQMEAARPDGRTRQSTRLAQKPSTDLIPPYDEMPIAGFMKDIARAKASGALKRQSK